MIERFEFKRMRSDSTIDARRENARLRAALIAAEDKRPDMVVTVIEREAYGVARFYPDNDAARLFSLIAGTATLTDPVLDRVRKLGYRVEIKAG